MKETLWLLGIHPKPYNDSQEWVPVPRAQRPFQGLYGYDSLPKKQNLFSRYNGLQRLHGATAKRVISTLLRNNLSRIDLWTATEVFYYEAVNSLSTVSTNWKGSLDKHVVADWGDLHDMVLRADQDEAELMREWGTWPRRMRLTLEIVRFCKVIHLSMLENNINQVTFLSPSNNQIWIWSGYHLPAAMLWTPMRTGPDHIRMTKVGLSTCLTWICVRRRVQLKWLAVGEQKWEVREEMFKRVLQS